MWLMNVSLFYPARNELTSHSWFNKVFYTTIDDNQYQINHKFNCLHYTLMSELQIYIISDEKKIETKMIW